MSLKVVAVAFALSVIGSEGHAYLSIPKGRNVYGKENGLQWNMAGLDAGGPTHLYTVNGGIWPGHAFPETHGLCGQNVGDGSTPMSDEDNMMPTPIQATYVSGSIVEFEVIVTAHHWGYYEFRICDTTVSPDNFATRTEAQACFDQHLLVRADPLPSCQIDDADPDCQPIDPNYPERWYLPRKEVNNDIHKMRYQLPEGLECSACTVQWYWPTSNTCVPDQGQYDYFLHIASLGWDTSGWFDKNNNLPYSSCENRCCGVEHGYGQEFWNCADITISAADASATTTGVSTAASQTQTTVTAPTPAPSTSTVTTVTSSAPASSTATPCVDLCLKTNLTSVQSTCVQYGDQSSCESGFVSVVGGAASIPCKWVSDCSCVADAAALMLCPECIVI
mmetsp:Transcript_51843/g.123352  ORF Transcript_51843/g.123352 Transcript_51843/m.123352 type:complete len:391 (-) Transcript_51843:197-1369(-)